MRSSSGSVVATPDAQLQQVPQTEAALFPVQPQSAGGKIDLGLRQREAGSGAYSRPYRRNSLT